ncbi:hypothetical protein VSR34_04660 [Paraburkholderia sp. JHI2823]|uniref:hypothetical protein n=1 Tax=Paraburkholderia TaxID=1822464 RepID=UPI0012B551B4|nr:hypothetical protein [Paraburkholderia mimosarum]
MNAHIAASACVLRKRRSGLENGKALSGLVTEDCLDHAVQIALKITTKKWKIIQNNSILVIYLRAKRK